MWEREKLVRKWVFVEVERKVQVSGLEWENVCFKGRRERERAKRGIRVKNVMSSSELKLISCWWSLMGLLKRRPVVSTERKSSLEFATSSERREKDDEKWWWDETSYVYVGCPRAHYLSISLSLSFALSLNGQLQCVFDWNVSNHWFSSIDWYIVTATTILAGDGEFGC